MNTCERCGYYESDGQAEVNGKIMNLCVKCAWVCYDEVDGNVEIVESL